jgi:excisionase family DNA binding protein
MSSNIRITRICQQCGNEFTAKTTVTQYCSDPCAKRAYKARIKAVKVEKSNTETQAILSRPMEEIKAKEFLTVKDVTTLLSCSRQTVYKLIKSNTVKAVNISLKKTLIKRSEIDKLFQ